MDLFLEVALYKGINIVFAPDFDIRDYNDFMNRIFGTNTWPYEFALSRGRFDKCDYSKLTILI
jgi:hypothetical protein